MSPSPDTSARATPSLQWVPWPPLAGALRFPTFLGTMGYYDCSRSVRTPPVDPWGHVPPLMGRRSRALFGSWTIPVETCLGLGDRKSTRLNSSHGYISYAVFCLKK